MSTTYNLSPDERAYYAGRERAFRDECVWIRKCVISAVARGERDPGHIVRLVMMVPSWTANNGNDASEWAALGVELFVRQVMQAEGVADLPPMFDHSGLN